MLLMPHLIWDKSKKGIIQHNKRLYTCEDGQIFSIGIVIVKVDEQQIRLICEEEEEVEKE